MTASNKAKILVVEDNTVNLELFMDLIKMGGHECIHSTKGEDVLEIVKREKPDLLLLDIQLPGIDGMEVGKILRADEETKNLKVIALTAYAMKGDKEMFLEKGFDGYIPKPVKMKEFLEAIEGYLGGK